MLSPNTYRRALLPLASYGKTKTECIPVWERDEMYALKRMCSFDCLCIRVHRTSGWFRANQRNGKVVAIHSRETRTRETRRSIPKRTRKEGKEKAGNQTQTGMEGGKEVVFAWPLPFDLPGMGNPTNSFSSSQHNYRDHRNTQASPRQQNGSNPLLKHI